MMRKFLFYLQRQPRETRVHYAFVGSVITTGIIALVWMSYIAAYPTASTYTAALSESNRPSVVADDVQPSSAPLGGFWKEFKEQVAELGDIKNDLQSAFSSSTKDTNTAGESAGTRNYATTTDATKRNVTITHEFNQATTTQDEEGGHTASTSRDRF